jgi:hypothetical protein
VIDRRIALFGTPGAGKSTSSQLLEEICRERAISFRRIRLAEPLYDCQAEIYRIAGRPLANRYVQDGELLNFLGLHLRKINGTVLIDRFRERVGERPSAQSGTLLLTVCDDMRAPDAPSLETMGFRFVRVVADPARCRQRREQRGDMALGSETHVTERGLDGIREHFAVRNESTKAALRDELDRVLDAVLP